MKKMMTCGVFGVLMLSSTMASAKAHAGFNWKWGNFGRPYVEAARGFERIDQLNKYESSRYEQNVQWTKLEDNLSLTELNKANIFTRHCLKKKGYAHIEVGPSFYRLSGADKRRAIMSLDKQYKYTEQGAKTLRLVDVQSRQIVGVYGSEGLMLQ